MTCEMQQFQSPPDPEAGCDTRRLYVIRGTEWFQSPPDPEAGCDLQTAALAVALASFNPHPTRRPGATSCSSSFFLARSRFQSPPDPEAGCDTRALI